MRLSSRERWLLTATVALFLVWLAVQLAILFVSALAHVADVLLIFLVAWAVAYLLEPLVGLVIRRARVSRTPAVILVYIAFGLVLGTLIALGIPALAAQLAALTERGPEFGEKAEGIVADMQARLDASGIHLGLTTLYGDLPGRLGELTGTFAADALGVVAATGTLLFNVSLVLIIAFLMLVDGERMWDRFTATLSRELQSEAELLRQSADRSFGGFLRASLILGLVYGVATFVILVPLGVPFAGILALVSGIVMVIPFFGPIIAAIPVFLATILGAPQSFLPVFVLTMALQQVVLNIVGPRVMSNVIGIHPIFVFLAIMLGVRLAGFWGVLLAMPVAGIANTFLRYAYDVTQGRRSRTEAHLVTEEEEEQEPRPPMAVRVGGK